MELVSIFLDIFTSSGPAGKYQLDFSIRKKLRTMSCQIKVDLLLHNMDNVLVLDYNMCCPQTSFSVQQIDENSFMENIMVSSRKKTKLLLE